MAYAPSLDGAFLFGEGVHGWVDGRTGRYMDGLWLYDVKAHRWRNVSPGTDTRNPPELIVNRDGFMAVADGTPVPIATMVHGYQMTTWDSRRRRFMAMPNGHGYYKKPLPTVAAFITANRERFNRSGASPWMFDIGAGRWMRSAITLPGRSPPSGVGDTLIYLASRDTVFFRHRKQIWFYQPERNVWTRRNPTGPKLPFGIDATACYDPKRGRLYLGGGSYPVAKGPNALWIYDIDGDRFIDPGPRGDPGGNGYGTNGAMLFCDLARDLVLLVRHKGKRRGIYAYRPGDNAWETVSRGLPAMWPDHYVSNGSSGFYHPGLDIYFFHVAGDSRDNGRILAYRYGRPRRMDKGGGAK